jgi:hypothetical protein
MPAYYSGRDGDAFADATLHTDAECCPDPTRPIADSSVESLDSVAWCDDCGPTETCEVVKNDGEVCGRELPCPYHSD